jgi:DNA mismatch endonuclease (patch repair protein)
MTDVFSKAKRSEVMSRIRGKDNASTELRLISILRSGRVTGWRRHIQLPGRPDFAFRKEKVAVFVDGCFWHFCSRCAKLPENNAEFWRKKLLGNKERDRAVSKQIREKGWISVRVWEHELQNHSAVLKRLRRALARTGGADVA